MARALADIPPPFRDSLREVAIVIEDEPGQDQLDDDELGRLGINPFVPWRTGIDDQQTCA